MTFTEQNKLQSKAKLCNHSELKMQICEAGLSIFQLYGFQHVLFHIYTATTFYRNNLSLFNTFRQNEVSLHQKNVLKNRVAQQGQLDEDERIKLSIPSATLLEG